MKMDNPINEKKSGFFTSREFVWMTITVLTIAIVATVFYYITVKLFF